ncbi:pseudouridine synthase [Pelagibacterium limicola]|uniref:pseudouridine synthase n=1 Tax=Pelagibacterium limicola TaxID=2791022 RepID=UPI0018AF8AFE|nr:pseudouridine synthase [Pelagibacterium limicola]
MSDKPAPQPGERLAKAVARAGICSRRDAETWIAAGRVAVNGSVVKTPAFNVVEADTIAVDGKEITRKQATQLWLYHKPAGLMVTEKDPEGRPTVFEALTRLGLPRVLTVGRLDFNTEGLLLLTNDGGLKRTLELPATGWVRRYRVRAFGSVTQEKLDTLKEGVTVEGVEYGPIDAELDTVTGSNVWMTVGLREGKNREVRNVLGALGLEVNRLIRISYGPFQLGDLPSGHVEKVKTRILKDQLGKKLAAAAGADFDTPEPDEAGQPRRRAPEKTTTERDRYTGLRRRPDNRREERPEQAPRTVHFDDGRPSESFTPRGKPRGGKDGGRDERPARGEGFKKRFDDKPRRPSAEGDNKPFRKGPRAAEGERPVRKDGYKPRFEREAGDADARPRRFGPRPEGASGDRPFRKEGYRPRSEGGDKREFGDRAPRRDGGKPFGKGPRPEGASGDRPFRKEGYRPRSEGGDKREFGDRAPRHDGGKPFAKGPRREFDGDRPPRRKDEDRPLARRSAPGKEGKFGQERKGPRKDGGKPSGGPKRPDRGPRRDDTRPSGGRPFNKGPRRPRDE